MVYNRNDKLVSCTVSILHMNACTSYKDEADRILKLYGFAKFGGVCALHTYHQN